MADRRLAAWGTLGRISSSTYAKPFGKGYGSIPVQGASTSQIDRYPAGRLAAVAMREGTLLRKDPTIVSRELVECPKCASEVMPAKQVGGFIGRSLPPRRCQILSVPFLSEGPKLGDCHYGTLGEPVPVDPILNLLPVSKRLERRASEYDVVPPFPRRR